jgi:tetratricopeptide (TPR) repeat protein
MPAVSHGEASANRILKWGCFMSKPGTVVILSILSFTLSYATPIPPIMEVPHFEGLGSFSRKITTGSAEAQRYFDQGLAFMYAFNHDEAIRSFRQAAKIDPKCAMAFWGIALANGPHINNPMMSEEQANSAWTALEQAKGLSANASPVEQTLIKALESRYSNPQPKDRKALDHAYADSMRHAWATYRRDPDVGALFAESLADLRPWDLWTSEGKPNPGTEEIIEILNSVLAIDPKHPLANHLLIHAVEASPRPEIANRAADVLRDLQPGLGHLVHMPSHIDVRCGRWEQCIVANMKAINADARYKAQSKKQHFYRLYMAHNHHMLVYGAMMTGRSALALKIVREMVADIPVDYFRENSFMDGFMAMPLEVMMRFGQWDNILAEPAFPDFVPISRTLQHYARAIAYAAKEEVPSAMKERAAFLETRRRVPEDAFFGNNTGRHILDIADSFMNGEILYRSGKFAEGLSALREAVALEDKLRYDEPPAWILPARHALGAALLQTGNFAEAEAVFRKDLERLPENGWGLYGLLRALQAQNRRSEAEMVETRFDATWKHADIQIKSPCLCLPGV